MRAIRKTIDGVNYDTGTARRVHQAWDSGPEEDLVAELTLYRGDTGHWFELRREPGQLYGALLPLSAAEAARWLSRHAGRGEALPLATGEAGVPRFGPRLRAAEPLGG